jgi:hypothetical protein
MQQPTDPLRRKDLQQLFSSKVAAGEVFESEQDVEDSLAEAANWAKVAAALAAEDAVAQQQMGAGHWQAERRLEELAAAAAVVDVVAVVAAAAAAVVVVVAAAVVAAAAAAANASVEPAPRTNARTSPSLVASVDASSAGFRA